MSTIFFYWYLLASIFDGPDIQINNSFERVDWLSQIVGKHCLDSRPTYNISTMEQSLRYILIY